MELVNPEGLPLPRGYTHGVRAGPFLFVSGQVAFEGRTPVVRGKDIVEQFDRALGNLLEVVRAAGGTPNSLARLTIYVKDVKGYRARSREIGRVYRRRMGRHFPAMTCVEVRDLFDEGALVEIEAVALLEPSGAERPAKD